MALPIVFNNTAVNAGFFAENVNGLQGSSFTALELSPETYFFNGTVNAAGDAVVVTDGNGQTFQTLYATNFDDANHLVFTTNQNGSGFAYAISTQAFTQGQTINFTESALGDFVVCFVTGTQIRTERGDVAVEDLRVGDFAVTASGALRPITWIGHREITAEAGSLPFHQQPVHVRAGAFGHGLPARNLFLSPGHPVLVGADADNEGGVLVPVMCLINGTSITREPRATVTYWHVELDAHDILLAEGLPAESYIDGGDRAFFAEASDHALYNPDFVPAGWNGRCRPVAVEGSVVEAERLRLDAVFAGSLSAQCDWDAESTWASL